MLGAARQAVSCRVPLPKQEVVRKCTYIYIYITLHRICSDFLSVRFLECLDVRLCEFGSFLIVDVMERIFDFVDRLTMNSFVVCVFFFEFSIVGLRGFGLSLLFVFKISSY